MYVSKQKTNLKCETKSRQNIILYRWWIGSQANKLLYGISELGIDKYGIGEHGIGKHGIGEHGIGRQTLNRQTQNRRIAKTLQILCLHCPCLSWRSGNSSNEHYNHWPSGICGCLSCCMGQSSARTPWQKPESDDVPEETENLFVQNQLVNSCVILVLIVNRC